MNGRQKITPPRTETGKARQRGRKGTHPEPQDGEGGEGEFLGYTPTKEDLQIKELKGD